jgi:FtsZ-binding cell division protein ZapB
MQNQNAQLIEENKRLKDRLDIALNTIVLLQEEIQRLKDD